MKNIVICLIILASNVINAQHCGYDFSSIIVVKIHSLEDQNTIPNLRVTLVKKIKDIEVNSREYTLTQNNKFPFLSDEYSVIVSNNLDVENWLIRIESNTKNDNTEWKYYAPTEIKLSKNDTFPLCGNYDKTNYYENQDGRVYSPIEVLLIKEEL